MSSPLGIAQTSQFLGTQIHSVITSTFPLWPRGISVIATITWNTCLIKLGNNDVRKHNGWYVSNVYLIMWNCKIILTTTNITRRMVRANGRRAMIFIYWETFSYTSSYVSCTSISVLPGGRCRSMGPYFASQNIIEMWYHLTRIHMAKGTTYFPEILWRTIFQMFQNLGSAK